MNPTTHMPQLSFEQPACDDAEAALLVQLAKLLKDAHLLPDLRDIAPQIRQLFS